PKNDKGLVAESYDWDKESLSSRDEGTSTVKAFMAIFEDETSVGKSYARSGQWVEITMKKVKCKYVTRNTGKGRKNEENTKSYETLQHHSFVGYPFDYRVTLSFGSITSGGDHVNSVIRLPLEHGISWGPILRMTPSAGIEAIIELSKHSLSWYEEGDFKNKNLNVVFKQINNFEQNMNNITKEVQMTQHKYKFPDKGRISKPEETLSTFIKESRRKQKENENLFWKIKKNYDRTLKKQASSIKTIEGQSGINKALADLGASISLMSYSMFLRLNLGELKPTRICIELANKSTQIPKGIAKNVIVKIGRFVFPVEFVVLVMKEDHKIPIILGRSLLATAHAMIDVFNKKISFEVGNKTITFDLEKSMRFPPSDDDTCHSADIIDLSILNHVQEILPSEPDLINQISGDLEPESEDYTKPTLFAENMFEGEKSTPKLKDLPSHLEYAFLDNNQEFHVDGMKDNFKHVVQPQCKLNPKVQDVVKVEIVKLLDAGLIYAIYDSPWVSPIYVVPKKEESQLLLTMTMNLFQLAPSLGGGYELTTENSMMPQERITFLYPLLIKCWNSYLEMNITAFWMDFQDTSKFL
nr:hypothetical protein [Tanacetum cinerariifolium]